MRHRQYLAYRSSREKTCVEEFIERYRDVGVTVPIEIAHGNVAEDSAEEIEVDSRPDHVKGAVAITCKYHARVVTRDYRGLPEQASDAAKTSGLPSPFKSPTATAGLPTRG